MTAPGGQGELTIDVVARVASIRGIPLKLSHKEFQLLAKLASDPGRSSPAAEHREHLALAALDAHAHARLARIASSA